MSQYSTFYTKNKKSGNQGKTIICFSKCEPYVFLLFFAVLSPHPLQPEGDLDSSLFVVWSWCHRFLFHLFGRIPCCLCSLACIIEYNISFIYYLSWINSSMWMYYSFKRHFLLLIDSYFSKFNYFCQKIVYLLYLMFHFIQWSKHSCTIVQQLGYIFSYNSNHSIRSRSCLHSRNTMEVMKNWNYIHQCKLLHILTEMFWYK